MRFRVSRHLYASPCRRDEKHGRVIGFQGAEPEPPRMLSLRRRSLPSMIVLLTAAAMALWPLAAHAHYEFDRETRPRGTP